MGKYNFDKLTPREGTYSYKWDIDSCRYPMWVADMDFETAPCVKAALLRRAEHGIFGYSYAPDEYFSAYSDFWAKRHGYRFDTQDMIYSSGVVAAISSLVRKLTTPGENVLIQAPVYNIFYNSILNNGRRVLSSDLVLRDGEYHIDFSDLEAKMSHTETHLFILCNPHNPVGKVFTKDELERIAELARKYSVVVISDEIHCEFTNPKCSYTPFASVSEAARDNSITLLSASKAFNIAGLASACMVAKNSALRSRAYRAVNTDEVGEPNAFAPVANISALRDGEAWLDELVDYINENKRLAMEYIKENIPALSVPKSNATYLLWVSISSVEPDSVKFCDELFSATGVKFSDGAEYGECGKSFIRINLATSRANILSALSLLRDFVNGK